jgi:hypothetical protein
MVAFPQMGYPLLEHRLLSRNPGHSFLKAALDFAMKHFDLAGFFPCMWRGALRLEIWKDLKNEQGVDAKIKFDEDPQPEQNQIEENSTGRKAGLN